MADAQIAEPQRAFTERLFAAAPVPPIVAGVGLAVLLLALLFGITWFSGEFAKLQALAAPWWQNRDARLAILVALLAPTVATATRYHGLGTRANLEAVARLGGWPTEDIDPAGHPANTFRERRAATIGALMVPIFALLVDRDPTIYFQAFYWYPAKVYMWALGSVTTLGVGVLSYRAIRDARHFSDLARRLSEIDLLDPGRLAPFARQGLRSSVPGLLLISFIALNALDQGFLWAIVAIGGLGLVGVTAAFAIPLRGVRARVRRAKREELLRIHAAIRGEDGALRGSLIEGRESPGLADLLAYRAQVAAVPEWPLDISTLSRFAFYVAIPLASWVGGALVERALDAAWQ